MDAQDRRETTLAAEIKRRRLAFGWTQEELAKLLHVEAPAISYYERGITQVDPQKIKLLADIFGCTCDDLLGRQEKDLESRLDDAWLDEVGREFMRRFERMYKELHPEHTHRTEK